MNEQELKAQIERLCRQVSIQALIILHLKRAYQEAYLGHWKAAEYEHSLSEVEIYETTRSERTE